jgi:hypothetical protein
MERVTVSNWDNTVQHRPMPAKQGCYLKMRLASFAATRDFRRNSPTAPPNSCTYIPQSCISRTPSPLPPHLSLPASPSTQVPQIQELTGSTDRPPYSAASVTTPAQPVPDPFSEDASPERPGPRPLATLSKVPKS